MKRSSWVWFIIISLFILGVIILSLFFIGASSLKKISCEDSGGVYKLGFNEGGSYYYCSCPNEMYESYSKTCEVLTSSLIDKCVSLTNKDITCSKVSFNNYYQESVCECVFTNSNTKTYTVFRELLECDCKCSEDGCICSCPIKR